VADQFGAEGNIALDPLFCDPQYDDLTINAGSPCAPDSPYNPECGLIGAWPVACGGTPAMPTSWGGLKSRFRP
jgi:hypothetical protein